MTSCISRFYRLSMPERRARIGKVAGLEKTALARLQPAGGLSEQHADRMVENALGVFGLPLGLCVNLRINDRDVLAPMVVEEPSVVAACSYAAKLLRTGRGIRATCSEPIVVGQIQLLEVPDPAAAEAALLAAEPELLALADSKHPRLCGAGGGARKLTVRHLPAPGDDPCGDMFIVHLAVDVRDAMGANAVNSMCERLAPRIAALTGGRTALRILSNLSDERTVTVEGRIPFAALEGKGAATGELLAQRIEEASVFAERDPYRACTHNKGIMNGVDAALIALGQDWRAVEAGAHAYAARDGRYTAMARWRAEDGHLVGTMTIPLAVGTVGGVASSHPVVPIARRIAKIRSAVDVAQLCAAVGLAQNLGALRALAAEGIQHGHMRLHARNVAVEAGAEEHEVLEVARLIADAGQVNVRQAAEVIAQLRSPSPASAPVAALADPAEQSAGATATVIPRGKRPPTPAAPAVTDLPRAAPIPVSHRPIGGTVLVTGASAGHLGALLVRRLLDDGLRVRALVPHRGAGAALTTAALKGLTVELVFGDLRDEATRRAAVKGCDHVFHCAIDADADALRTRDLLQAAREAGVRRVVVSGGTSSGRRSGSLREAHSALLVEREALAACVSGLDVVLVSCATLVGPHDHEPSWLGRELIDFATGRKPADLPESLSLLAANDAVDGHLLAMTRGRRGQRYDLSTCTMDADDLRSIFEEVSGRSRAQRFPSRVFAPVIALQDHLGGIFGGAKAATGRDPHATEPDRHGAREIGFEPSSVRRAVHAAYLDFARRGLVPARAGTTEPPVIEIEAQPRRRSAGT